MRSYRLYFISLLIGEEAVTSLITLEAIINCSFPLITATDTDIFNKHLHDNL